MTTTRSRGAGRRKSGAGRAAPTAGAAKEEPAAASGEEKKAFVTVGTTKFEKLIRAMDCEGVLSSLAAAGYTSLTLQIGQGAYVPTRVGDVEVRVPGDAAEEVDGEGEEEAQGRGKSRRAAKKRRRRSSGGGRNATIRVEYFRLAPSLAAYMRASSLIISHAGAGSLFEGLNAGRRVIAVPNPDLMVNHQEELAKHLADSGFLLHADLTSIPRAVAAMETTRLSKYKPGNPAKMLKAIDAMF